MRRRGREELDFPVLLTVPRTLFLAGSSTTLLAAGRDVAVVEVVVLGTVSPATHTQTQSASLVV